MMEKHILLLSNGYGEDSFARLVAAALLEEAEKRGLSIHLSFVPLVGEGKLLAEFCEQNPQKCSLLHRSPPLRYGGVYLGNPFRRLGRFFIDTLAGGTGNLFRVIYLLSRIRKDVDMVVVVGDAFLLLLSFFALRKKSYLFACAHTALLRQKEKPYERLGRVNVLLFRHLTEKVYTRDHPTALWFQNLGINAGYCGFVGPTLHPKDPQAHIILFLPGHRQDWKANFRFLTETIVGTRAVFSQYTPHFVFPPEPASAEIEAVIQRAGGRILSPTSFSLQNVQITWSQGDYFLRLCDTALVVGFAGTALEHAAYLGIPCLEPYTEQAIQANRYFLEKRQKLLLREALIMGTNTPQGTARILEEVVADLATFQKKAQEFSEKTWQGKEDGARHLAQELLSTLDTRSPLPDRAPAPVDFGNGRR